MTLHGKSTRKIWTNVTVGLYSFALTELQQQEPRGFPVSHVCEWKWSRGSNSTNFWPFQFGHVPIIINLYRLLSSEGIWLFVNRMYLLKTLRRAHCAVTVRNDAYLWRQTACLDQCFVIRSHSYFFTAALSAGASITMTHCFDSLSHTTATAAPLNTKFADIALMWSSRVGTKFRSFVRGNDRWVVQSVTENENLPETAPTTIGVLSASRDSS